MTGGQRRYDIEIITTHHTVHLNGWARLKKETLVKKLTDPEQRYVEVVGETITRIWVAHVVAVIVRPAP